VWGDATDPNHIVWGDLTQGNVTKISSILGNSWLDPDAPVDPDAAVLPETLDVPF